MDGKGLVEGNIVEGGCSTEGIRVNNYNKVLVRSNVVYDITSSTAINVPAGAVVMEGNLAEGVISGGSKGPLISSAPSGSSLGSVTNKIEVFDKDGASIGFVPVYDAIVES